jgi:signal transduction histidine kinase/DNA-binding response OmpR family regulator
VTPKTAVVLPLTDKADDQLVGTLVLGVDPLLPFDDRYREFLALVSEAVAARMSEAHARQREHQRLQRLAELDRAKTEFFSNVSHEFRTPLTLMLGPLEDALRDSDAIPPRLRDELELARRNARRLLRLVGTMLDFSQIEAGRLRAHFAPVDLAERTRDIVAQFESAADRAGVRLNVELDELPQPVWVDVEMWEKIVSNLLSNALKFTFDGEIDVALHALPGHAELVVRDTGVGIPAEELPHIFKRFHRVRDTRARTYEGAGIGLALVNELVRRHHGRIRATSTLGDGTTFTVWIPTGRRPTMPGAAPVAPTSTASVAVAMAEEALRWGENPEPPTRHEEGDESALRQSLRAFAPDARLLVADDSSDMREYLQRLLGVHWKVDTASDGAEALALARRNRPDLVVADVMMPGLDGFALLRELRDDPTLQTLPVVLVTARAGEESAIEGLLAGADDYIVKPFSARELVARVGGQLELARTRKQAVELNEFLVRFSDTARTLATPETVAETACRMSVNELRANRAAWAEIDRDAGAYIADIVVLADGTPAEPSRGPLDESEAFTAEHRAGRSVVYTDITKEQRISDDAKREMERRGLRSGIAAPVCVAEELRLVLSVSDEEPRVWTSKEVALVEALAGRAWAEVERARVEAALRAREEWQSFILRLSDVLRPLDDPTEIKAAAARLLAEHLAVTRAEYFEADSSGEYLETVGGYADGELGRVGRVPIAALGEAVASSFRAARTVAIADFREDPLIAPEERPAYETRDFRAFVGAPLFKGGRLVAMLVAVDAAVRQWTPDEVALVEETAERTWSAVERTRAEGTLREREQQQAFLLTVSEAVQRLTDASQIQAAAGNLLRERLAVSRVFFSEMEGDEWIVGEVYGDSATIAPGRYPAGEYGRWTMDTLRAGRVIAIEDTATAAELRPSEREALQRIGNRAVAGVPLLRDGEIAAVLTVHHSEPRPWTQTDLTLLRETAERTWPAVERARAERALRERDGQLQ